MPPPPWMWQMKIHLRRKKLPRCPDPTPVGSSKHINQGSTLGAKLLGRQLRWVKQTGTSTKHRLEMPRMRFANGVRLRFQRPIPETCAAALETQRPIKMSKPPNARYPYANC